jgi:GNAT superfamily N-acetyltransferase
LSSLEQNEEARIRRWEESLADNRGTCLVAEDSGRILGFISFGMNRDGMGQSIGEIYALYVDPDVWDRHIGTALIDGAEAQLSASGFRSAVLWTLAAYDRTCRFYERRDWHFDGAVRSDHRLAAELVQYSKDLV